MNIERLQKLAETLESVPDEHFNINAVVSFMDNSGITTVFQEIVDGKRKGCGAAACVYGYFPIAFPEHFTYDSVKSDEDPRIVVDYLSSAYAKQFARFMSVSLPIARIITDPQYYSKKYLKHYYLTEREEAIYRLNILMTYKEKGFLLNLLDRFSIFAKYCELLPSANEVSNEQ